MKARGRYRDSVIVKWNLAYAIFFLVVMVVFVVCVQQCINTIEDEVEYSNSIVLETMRYQVDDYVRNVRSLASTLALDSRVDDLLRTDSMDDVSRYGLYYQLQDYMEYAIVRDSIDEFYLYFPHLDLMMSNTYYNTAHLYYEINLKGRGFAFEDWYGLVSPRYDGMQLLSIDNAKSGKTIAVVRSVRVNLNASRYANLVMILDMDKMVRASQVLDTGRESVFLYDRLNGRIVSDKEMDWTPMLSAIGSVEAASGNFEIDFDGEPSIVSYTTSQQADWLCGMVTAKSSYMGSITVLSTMLIVFCIIYMLVGATLIVVLTRRHYRSVRQIASRIGITDPQGLAGNEYQNIAQSITNLIHEKEQIEELSDTQRTAIRRSLLRQIAYVSSPLQLPMQQILWQYDIVFATQQFIVVAFRLQGHSLETDERRLAEAMEAAFTDKDMQLFSFMEQETAVYFVNPHKPQTDLMGSFREAVAQVWAQLQAQGVHCLAAVSNVVTSWESIHGAYRNVERVFEQQQSSGMEEGISYFSDINALPVDTLLRYSGDMDNRVYSCIVAADAARAYDEAVRILEDNRKSCYSKEAILFLMSNIVNTVFRAAGEVIGPGWTPPGENTLAVMYTEHDPERMHKYLHSLMEAVCQEITQFRAEEKLRMRSENHAAILAYVEAHYSDPDLNVNSIATTFGVNITTLSKWFKDENGENLSVHINQVRLRHAKAMILEGARVEDTAESCGYASARTFLRVFKQYTGLTPTQYRKSVDAKGGGQPML